MFAPFQTILTQQCVRSTFIRSFHYKFKRVKCPPLQQPKESPYIVGPYLKPDYLPVEYLTDPIKHKDANDLDYYIYEPTKIEPDEERKVKLLLLDDVEGLGVMGQVVDAPYRLGASKLIAMKRADYYTEFTKKWYKFGPKDGQSASSALSPRTARLLRTKVYELPLAKSVMVKPWHISLALRLSGCICPISAIEPDSISELMDEDGEQQVKCTIRINNHEQVEVRLRFSSSSQDK